MEHLNDEMLALAVIEIGDAEPKRHIINGGGRCKECDCGNYDPDITTGICLTYVYGRPNNVCGHVDTQHWD